MANHKQAKKRAKQNIKKNRQNKWKKSRVRTFIKKLRNAIESKDGKLASELLPKTQSLLDKLGKSSAVSDKKTARLNSRLAQQVAGL